MNKPLFLAPHHRGHGFTFVEVMFALTIGVVVLGMGAGLLIEMFKGTYKTAKRLELNQEIRRFTGHLAKETIDANEFYVLSSYLALNGQADMAKVSTRTLNQPLADAQSGDCLVLGYRGNPTNLNAYTEVRVYFRDTTNPALPAVIRFYSSKDSGFPNGWAAGRTIDTILNSDLPKFSSTHSQQPQLVTLNVYGLPYATPKPIFFNFNDRAVSVNCRFETTGTADGAAKLSASSFNYTISPRE